MSIKIETLNVRGLKRRLQAVHKLSRDTYMLGLCETWMTKKDEHMREALDVTVDALNQELQRPGYWGVALILNPVIAYKKIDQYASPTIQYATVSVANMIVTVLYISPRAQKDEELEVLARINQLNGGTAIIMGDLNARYGQWGSTKNPRGNRLKRWAEANGWNLNSPKEPSFVSNKGTSNPDIFMTKGIEISEPFTDKTADNGGSDHLPVLSTVSTSGNKSTRPKGGHIPRKQRNNPKILEEARKLLGPKLKVLSKKIETINTKGALENAYKKSKETLLEPWEVTRNRKVNRFRPFWNGTLDWMSKTRKNCTGEPLRNAPQKHTPYIGT